MYQYILEGRIPKRCDDMATWCQWMATANRHVARDEINGITVSTVFLAIYHAFNGGAPVLFETMVFGGSLDCAQERYATWEEAEAGHKAMLARVRQREAWPEEV